MYLKKKKKASAFRSLYHVHTLRTSKHQYKLCSFSCNSKRGKINTIEELYIYLNQKKLLTTCLTDVKLNLDILFERILKNDCEH